MRSLIRNAGSGIGPRSPTSSQEPGKEAREAFMRFHFAKIKWNQDRWELFDNFNQKAFVVLKHPNPKDPKMNSLSIQSAEGETIVSIHGNSDKTEFDICSPWSDILGEIVVHENTNNNNEDKEDRIAFINSAEIFTKSKSLRLLEASRVPLIQNSHEFQISNASSAVVGRINVNGSQKKAIVSMQPELDVFHRVRIIGTALIFLNSW